MTNPGVARFVHTLLFSLTGLLAGCAPDDTVPAHPTWVDDVQPILRGNCLNCHGATALKTARIMRWDVCDLTAFAEVGPFQNDPLHADPMDPEVEFIGARTRIPQTFTTYLQPHGAEGPLMPPRPSPALSEQQLRILAAWIKDPVCGKRASNHKPAAVWLNDQNDKVQVTDLDGDQVLGTMTCGLSQTLISHTGAADLPAGAHAPCVLKLSDGQDSVSLELNR
jgi:hypothetical protein